MGVGALTSLQDGCKSRTELDSHANTCVVSKNALILYDFYRAINVTGYNTSQDVAQSLPIVSAALAYDDPKTGEVIFLVLNQAIHIPLINHKKDGHAVDITDGFVQHRSN